MSLTFLCISDQPPHAERFLEQMAATAHRLGATFVDYDGSGAGILEHVLDDAVAACPEGHILLLADDELPSAEMVDWLATGVYAERDHWAFPRRHLWPDENSYITTPPLWPDLQTRLSSKQKSGGRGRIHAGSPFGTGHVAPVAIDHHKFLVRSVEDRRRILAHYASIDPRAGTPHYAAFSVPEDLPSLDLVPVTAPAMTPG